MWQKHLPHNTTTSSALQRHSTAGSCTACRFFYISILYNVCYTFALYGLMLFWIGASELLQPFNPLLKFILVKTVVFLTFWQVSFASVAQLTQ